MSKITSDKKPKDPKDSFLTGIGVAVAFIGAAILLFLNKNYFGNEFATNTFVVLFLLFGAVGLNTEIEKYSKKSFSFDGGELAGALLFLIPWYIFQFQPHFWTWNIALIIAFLLGVTFAVRWIARFGERIYQSFSTPGVISKIKIIGLIIAQIIAVIAALATALKQLQDFFV